MTEQLIETLVQSVAKNVESLDSRMTNELKALWGFIEQDTFRKNIQLVILHGLITLLSDDDFAKLELACRTSLGNILNSQEEDLGEKQRIEIIKKTVPILTGFLEELRVIREDFKRES